MERGDFVRRLDVPRNAAAGSKNGGRRSLAAAHLPPSSSRRELATAARRRQASVAAPDLRRRGCPLRQSRKQDADIVMLTADWLEVLLNNAPGGGVKIMTPGCVDPVFIAP